MRISFYDQHRITTDSLLQMILSIAASIGADPLEMNALYEDANAKLVLDSMRKRHGELKAEFHDTSFPQDTYKCKSFLKDYDNVLRSL